MVPCVPLFLLDNEGGWPSLRNRMWAGLDSYGCLREIRNVAGETDAAEKVGKPRRHGIAIEVAQQCSMVKAYPSTLAVRDVILEGLLRSGRPSIGW